MLRISETTRLMGNRFDIVAVDPDEIKAKSAISAAIEEISRIENLLSTYKDQSLTNQINEAAGIKPVKVCQEFFDLVERSRRISELTQGAFDLSYGSIDKKLWNFDTTMRALPSVAEALKSVALINYQNIELDNEKLTVFLRNKGMRIGFGGIGKGYAAEKAKGLMRTLGIDHGVVNAAGDLTTWGQNEKNEDWTVGVADPDFKNKAFSSIKISNISIATSGHYEKYAVINGKKYGHTIDPKTGLPVEGIKSVSVICPNAELADALATPLMIMGTKIGIEMINQMQNISCIIIDQNNKIHTSKNIKITT